MKTSLALALSTLFLLVAQSAFAQDDSVMNRGMMDNGGYAGLWLPALLIVGAIAIAVWGIRHRRK